MVKYQKWLDKNTHLLTNSLAIVVGGTGSIGSCVVDYLLTLKSKVIIAARNTKKAEELKNLYLLKYPTAKIYVEELDISSLDSIDAFQLSIDKKYPKADIFINAASIYNAPTTNSADGYEIHFATNALGNYYLAKKIMFDLKKNAKMIFVSSLAYNIKKVDFSDIQSIHSKKPIDVYSVSKRIMTFNTVYLKNQLKNHDISVNLCHPGISATGLFLNANSKFMRNFCYPIMKVFFHKPQKAALSVIKAIFTETEMNEWIGPRGLSHVWGYPTVYPLSKDMVNPQLYNKMNVITEDLILRHNEVKGE